MMHTYITGMSAILPLGAGAELVVSTQIIKEQEGCSIPARFIEESGWKGINRFSRAGKLCCITVGEALREADAKSLRLPDRQISPERIALVVGNNLSSLHPVAALRDEAALYGAGNVSPGLFPDTVLNSVGGYISIYFSVRGTNVTLSNGLYTAPKAFLYASGLLEQGGHDRVVVCIANLFPPDAYKKTAVVAAPVCEWITAFVLERSEETVEDLVHICVADESGAMKNGNSASLAVSPAEVDIAMLVHTRKAASPVTLITDLGAEGKLEIGLRRFRKEENQK